MPSKNWALFWESGAIVGEVKVEYKIKILKFPWLPFSHRRIITVVITSWPETSQIKILLLIFKVVSPVSRSIFYLANERLKLLQSKIDCETQAIAFQLLLQTSDNRWIILVTWVRKSPNTVALPSFLENSNTALAFMTFILQQWVKETSIYCHCYHSYNAKAPILFCWLSKSEELQL